MAGLPPLSGFLGKLLILDAATRSDRVWWIWAAILVTLALAVVGFARAGSCVFWKTVRRQPRRETGPDGEADRPPGRARPSLPLVAVGGAAWLALTAATVLRRAALGDLRHCGTARRQLYAAVRRSHRRRPRLEEEE